MRYTVTALGSAGDRPAGVVVGTIARYLVGPEPRPATPGAPSPGGGEREGPVARYYADRGDTPGRWLGHGARELDLAGEVDFDDFTSVLAGRDPRTGARLITARGSAGRVASLGTGTVARWGPNGEALYSVRDAARILGWPQSDVREAIVDGELLAAARLVALLTGTAGTVVAPGTHAAGTTGNGPVSDPWRSGNTATRALEPGRSYATGPANGTAPTTSARTPAHSTNGAGTAIPAGTHAAGTTGSGPGGDPGQDRDASTRTPGPGQQRAGGREWAGNGVENRPGPDRDTETRAGNALAGPGPAGTVDGRAGSDGARTGRVGGADRNDPGMALVPFVDRDGTPYVSDAELSRIEDLTRRGVSADAVREAGDPGHELSIPEAARLVGASPSYLARLCRSYLTHQDEITATLAEGGRPKRACMICRQDDDGRYRVTRSELAAFAERRRRPAVRVGYDVTATTEKSISVLAMLGSPQVRAEALAAVEAANDAGLRWLEYHAAAARAGGQVVGVTGWTAASFQHLTSRRLDPFVHHHNVVANTVVDEHGDRRALDARPVYRNVAAASAIATAQVRWELTRRLGVAWRPARHGGWEISGIPDGVLDEFSRRRREINDAIRELEHAVGRASTLDELQSVVATTRPTKTDAAEADLLADWWHRAERHGLSAAGFEDTLDRVRPTVLSAGLRARILNAAAGAVTAQRSIFTRGDLLAILVDLPHPDGDGPLIVPAATLEQLADELLGSTRVVRLESTTGREDTLQHADGTALAVGGEHEPEYSTTDMLALQARILDNFRAGIAAGAGTIDHDVLDATVAHFPELSTEQHRLVTGFCTSGDRAQSAIGRPGTGKTHTMRAAVAAWQAAGYRVVGTAVKAEAARHLGRECGIFAEPLAWYLNRIGDPRHNRLDVRTVLIVDEASTIGDRALDRLLAGAKAAGATVRFIGDPAQHGSVPAGGMWHHLVALHADRTPGLTVDRRVQHTADRAAAEALRDGQVADALAALEAAGHLHILDSERDLYIALLTRWWTTRQTGHRHPIVDRRNDQRLVLNRLARALRRHAGELGNIEIVAGGDRRFAVGDDIVARMGDRNLHPSGQPHNYVRNGTHGIVAAVHPAPDPADDRITVGFHGLGEIILPRAFFDEHRDVWGRLDVGIDHAYAITSYAVEGLTYDESTSHVDARSSRPEVYVDITRGRHANHVYVTAPEDHLDGERLPAAPNDPERTQLEYRLTHSGAEHAAIAVDPLAAAAAAYAEGKTLARLSRELLNAADTAQAAVIARAEQMRKHQIRWRATSRPDPGLVRQLGPRPSEAHLARRWEDRAGDLAIDRARLGPSEPYHGFPAAGRDGSAVEDSRYGTAWLIDHRKPLTGAATQQPECQASVDIDGAQLDVE
jgi:conjugative relaxase-like TrwC/TraI family protein